MPIKGLIPTEEQCDVIAKNINHFFDRNSDDPHLYLAKALGVSRTDAKELLFSFMYKEDAWFPRMFRASTVRESFYLNELSSDKEERRAITHRANEAADAREDRVFPPKV